MYKAASFVFFTVLQISILMGQTPKLVVGIVVDQMRYDYLLKFNHGFGQNGFKRLMREGYNFSSCHINYFPSYTAPGHAAIYTGTYPAVHGIVSNEWYERQPLKYMYCVSDDSSKTIGSNTPAGKMSPKNLYTTTMTDQLELATQGKSKTYGICIKDRGAILPAGHNPDGCYWFDYKSGNWITSSYYKDSVLPDWLENYNNIKAPALYLQETWKRFLPENLYIYPDSKNSPFEGYLSSREVNNQFPHILPQISNENDFSTLLSTPFGNNMTRRVAMNCIIQNQMGVDSITDFLALSFSSTDYIGHLYGIDAAEVEDTYYRLDRELDTLFTFLDKKLGKGNYMIFLTSDHGCAHNPGYMKEMKFPAGYFNSKFMLDSLNRMLERSLQTPGLVKYIKNQQIFLNDSIIQFKYLNKKAISEYIASFISKFDGVDGTMTSWDVQHGMYPSEGFDIYFVRGYRPERCGDVYYKLKAGWLELTGISGSTHGSTYDYDTHIPFIMMGGRIKQGTNDKPVYITDIAPTICNLLGLQYPDGCKGSNVYAK